MTASEAIAEKRKAKRERAMTESEIDCALKREQEQLRELREIRRELETREFNVIRRIEHYRGQRADAIKTNGVPF